MRGEKNQQRMEIMCQGTRTLLLESAQETWIEFLESLDYSPTIKFQSPINFVVSLNIEEEKYDYGRLA